jgi:hypothetical protein
LVSWLQGWLLAGDLSMITCQVALRPRQTVSPSHLRQKAEKAEQLLRLSSWSVLGRRRQRHSGDASADAADEDALQRWDISQEAGDAHQSGVGLERSFH